MKQGNHILQIFFGNVRNKGFCLITAFVFSLLGQTLSGQWTIQWKEEMGSASNYSVAAVESRPRAVGTIAVAGTRMDENGIDRAVLDVYTDEDGAGPTLLTSIAADSGIGRFAGFTALAWEEKGDVLLVAGNYVGGIRIKTDDKVAELTDADEEPTNHAFIAQFSFSGDGVSVNGLTKFQSDQAIALCRDPSDGGVFWFLTGSGKIHKLNLDEKQQILSVEETLSTGLAGTTDLFVGENKLAVIGNNNNKGTLKTFRKGNPSGIETFPGDNNEHFTSLTGDGEGGFYVTGKKGGAALESEERLLIRAFGKNNWRVDATGSTRSWGAGISIVGSRIFVAGTFNNEIIVGGNELSINEQVNGAVSPRVVLVELGKEKGNSIRLQSLDEAISYSSCLDESGTLLAGSILNRNGELLSCLVKLHVEDPYTPSLDFGLVAWYPFDGNANDMSGNGHHGTVFGATLTDDRNGEHGKAYLFDGRDDFIDFGSNPAFNSFPLTVGVWVKSNGNSGESGIVSKYRAASWNGWQIMEQEDKIVPWYIRSHGQRIIGNYGEPKPFETVLQSPEQWNHLVCVFDEDGGRIYLNGSLQDTKAWTGDPAAPTASHGLYIGRYKGAGLGFYSGRIDDVRIYDRTLSADEVTELYELEKPRETISFGNAFVLSNDSVKENKPIGTEVGWFISYVVPPPSLHTPIDPILLTVDWDGEPTLQHVSQGYTLVEGKGSTHNHYFTIVGGVLKTARVLKAKDTPILSIRVKVIQTLPNGAAGAGFFSYSEEKAFTITVLENPLDINPPPDPTDYEKKYDEALARLEALKILDKKADADIAQRRGRLAKLDDELSVADKSLQEVNSSLAACEQVCEGLKSDHRAIDTSIGVEDARIYGLNGKIVDSEKQLTELENDKSKLAEDLTEAERKGSVPHTPGWHFIDDKGWLWTHPDYFPLVYSEQVAGWFYYEPGTQTPWLYYEYNTESWQEW